MDKKSFTLLELMLVVAIVGIIATFAIPGYMGVRRRAEGRQSSTQLRLLHAAEKIEMLEENSFAACAGFAACNAALDLELPDDGWTYNVVCTGGCGNDFTATATDAAGSGCVYTMTRNLFDPTDTANCVFQIP